MKIQTDTEDFLIELGTEDLPSRLQRPLLQRWSDLFVQACQAFRIDFSSIYGFVTPRRLALYVQSMHLYPPAETVEEQGPLLSLAYDQDGCPTPAGLGFARRCGVELNQLEIMDSPRGRRLRFSASKPSVATVRRLACIVVDSLKSLSVEQRMRWGDSDETFVRPVVWVLALLGSQVVEMTLWGQQASNKTYGHRFHDPQPLELSHPNNYEHLLKKHHVIADSEQRRAAIVDQIKQLDKKQSEGHWVIDPLLLDEVTGLVEWPVVLEGVFDDHFLILPQEVLIQIMKQHQRYFHGVDTQGALLPRFVCVANLESKHPERVIQGNQRVMCARLTDANFFYHQDRKQTLMDRVPALKHVVFQEQLGSLYDKARRIAHSAELLTDVSINREHLVQAAWLAKADLVSHMVIECPELQGVMGYHYAKAEGCEPDIAMAIQEHYHPNSSKGDIPATLIGAWLSVLDRTDTLVGSFGVGQIPCGDKDPFGLRRHALAVLRIIIDYPWPKVTLLSCLDISRKAWEACNPGILQHPGWKDTLLAFFVERLRFVLLERGVDHDLCSAVLSVNLENLKPVNVWIRAQAIQAFQLLPEAEGFIAAMKRIENLIKRCDPQELENLSDVDFSLLRHPAEIALWEQTERLMAASLSDQNLNDEEAGVEDYVAFLRKAAVLTGPINQFLDGVFVFEEEVVLRRLRVSVLVRIRSCVERLLLMIQ